MVLTAPSHCLNCGAALQGTFCSHCGQRVIPAHPTVRELAGDAYDELVGWDGKFAATIRTLITRPGALTHEFLEGRRARYLSPVRLYLMCSVVYFVAAAMVPLPVSNDGRFDFSVGVGVGSVAEQQTPGEAAFAKAVAAGSGALTPDDRILVAQYISEQPGAFQPLMRAMATDFAGLQRRILEIMPRALFLLIPALAAILALFHRRRPYPDHLYFALHLQTFAFAVLALSAVVQFGAPLWLIATAQMAAAMWILVYAILAQRRVYGETWVRTLLTAVGTAMIYGTLWTSISLAVTLWVSRGR
ncbi:MAG TPA: DUF3667 domain-containing protein [Vicinamibacterales bacterium]|nr:DUF3667 domain-containing protein [Vicinamibacterales bacterium]